MPIEISMRNDTARFESVGATSFFNIKGDPSVNSSEQMLLSHDVGRGPFQKRS